MEIRKYLTKVLIAGDKAGILSEEGAKLLDPSGALEAGIPFYVLQKEMELEWLQTKQS